MSEANWIRRRRQKKGVQQEDLYCRHQDQGSMVGSPVHVGVLSIKSQDNIFLLLEKLVAATTIKCFLLIHSLTLSRLSIIVQRC